eukprot:sb/3474110/
MNAVERIDNYATQVPVEADEGTTVPPKEWPTAGEIQFCEYSASYDEKLDPVLKKVDITVRRHNISNLVVILSTMNTVRFNLVSIPHPMNTLCFYYVLTVQREGLTKQLCFRSQPVSELVFVGELVVENPPSLWRSSDYSAER